MSDFDLFKMGWQNGWASEQDMKDAVVYGILTTEQYQEIVGYEFEV
ncbi:XkdX family protein [Paenibacillus macerans]